MDMISVSGNITQACSHSPQQLCQITKEVWISLDLLPKLRLSDFIMKNCEISRIFVHIQKKVL